ncbi:alpha-2-macroglobulin family protein [Patescibacteria group bacterium]
MNKFKLGVFAVVLCAVAIAGFSFSNKADGQDNSRLYVFGQNQYERNGIISVASTDEPAVTVSGHDLGDKITIDLYRASMDDVLNFLVHNDKGDQLNYNFSLDRFTKITTLIQNEGGKISLPVDGTGVWLICAQSGDASVRSFLVRSSYGAVAKEGNDKFVFWVQDFTTKRSVSDTRIRTYSLENNIKEEYEVRTGSDGTVEAPVSAKYDVAVVGHGNDKALVPLNLRYLNYGNTYDRFQEKIINSKFFAFTDRPLYKPGDKMFFKTIIREDDNIRYSIPSGKVNVELVNSLGQNREVIFSGEYDISSFGTISGELNIPKNIKTGTYYLVIRDNKEGESLWGSSYVEVKIEYYQKPEFSLDMIVNDNEVISGENIEVVVQGDYFSGQPIKGYNVKYTVKESDFYDYSYYDYDYDIDNFRYGYRRGKEIFSGEVILDEKGHAKISLPANISGAKSKIYSIEIVTEGLGNQVFESKNVLVRSGQFNVYKKNRRYGAKVGEEVDMQFILKAYADISLANRTISVNTKRTWWERQDVNDALYYRSEKKEENLEFFDVNSDESGEFSFKFKPEHKGSYVFTISGEDDKGNRIEKTFSAWVSDRDGYYFSGSATSGLSLALDKEEYDPSETVNITISSDHEDRDVLLTMERHEVHRYRVVSLNGKSATIQEKLIDTDVPNISFNVTSFSNNKLDRAGSDAGVSAKGKKLFITMNLNKQHYEPGDIAEIEVSVKDQDGDSQQTDLAIWAVDKAIFELVDRSGGDIFNYFWRRRGNSTMMAHSLEGINISMAEKGGCFAEGTRVLMSGGEEKNIEDVSVGEYVLTRTRDSQELISARVLKAHSIEVGGYLNINDVLHVTDNHVLWVNGSWKSAGDVEIGDLVVDRNGNNIEVNSLSWQRKNIEVYNLEVEEEHSYFANGIWVHNGKAESRSAFSDTAYWNPKVRTDKNGFARISFVVPDNLTTWVVSSIGVTKDSKVGEEIAEIVTTKDIIIRPQLPNILYKDDKLSLTALAQNFSKQDHTFKVGLRFDAGNIENQEQSILIPAGDSTFVEWNLSVLNENQDAQFEFYMEAVDSDDNSLRDSVITSVPVKKFGYREVNSWSRDESLKYDFKVSKDADVSKTSIELSLSTTLLGSLSPSMRYLVRYPYGCVEQTTSRFVPAVLAKENSEKFKDVLDGKNIDEFLAAGVDRLTKLQSGDGGWSWSSRDKSNIFVTAYASEYLLRAKNLGVDVDQSSLNRAKNYFDNLVIASSDFQKDGSYIIILYGRSLFDSDKDRREIANFSEKTPVDLVSLAVMTNIKNGFHNSQTNGVEYLKSISKTQGNGVFWDSGLLERFGSSHTSTALAVRALVAAGEKSEIVIKAVKYLSDTREGMYWSNTFATAQVIQAFVDFSKLEEEVNADLSYRVMLNDSEMAKGIIGKSKESEKISIPVTADLKNDSRLIIEVDGDNFLYSSLVMDEFRIDKNATLVSRGLVIEREYVNVKGDEYNIVPGDIVEVRLKVGGISRGQKYLVIEDQLPSGLVPVNERLANISSSGSNGRYYSRHKEYTQNGVVILERSPRSGVYTYKARAVSAGEFMAPPATTSLMYKPEIYAHSGVSKVNIDKEIVFTEKKRKSKQLVESTFLESSRASLVVVLITLGVISFLVVAYWKGYIRKG